VDPFSSADLTQRQQAYGRRFDLSDVYTPQMVVDGVRQCVGNRESEAEELIRKAAEQPKLAVRFSDSGRAGSVDLDVEGGALPGRRGDVYAAFAENEGQSDVLAGENRGLKLHYVAIIRKLRRLGRLNKNASFRGEVSVASFAGGRVIGFVQEQDTGAILGAAMYRIPR
jgi:hypothetical protein